MEFIDKQYFYVMTGIMFFFASLFPMHIRFTMATVGVANLLMAWWFRL